MDNAVGVGEASRREASAGRENRVSESSVLIEIDRLRGLSQIDILTDWGICRGDISTDVDLGEWDGVCLNEKGNISWERGSQVVWLGQSLVIPSHLHGYPVSGLLCRLALTWWADVAQVYVDGKLVQEGDLFDHSARVLLTTAATPCGTPAAFSAPVLT